MSDLDMDFESQEQTNTNEYLRKELQRAQERFSSQQSYYVDIQEKLSNRIATYERQLESARREGRDTKEQTDKRIHEHELLMTTALSERDAALDALEREQVRARRAATSLSELQERFTASEASWAASATASTEDHAAELARANGDKAEALRRAERAESAARELQMKNDELRETLDLIERRAATVAEEGAGRVDAGEVETMKGKYEAAILQLVEKLEAAEGAARASRDIAEAGRAQEESAAKERDSSKRGLEDATREIGRLKSELEAASVRVDAVREEAMNAARRGMRELQDQLTVAQTQKETIEAEFYKLKRSIEAHPANPAVLEQLRIQLQEAEDQLKIERADADTSRTELHRVRTDNAQIVLDLQRRVQATEDELQQSLLRDPASFPPRPGRRGSAGSILPDVEPSFGPIPSEVSDVLPPGAVGRAELAGMIRDLIKEQLEGCGVKPKPVRRKKVGRPKTADTKAWKPQ